MIYFRAMLALLVLFIGQSKSCGQSNAWNGIVPLKSTVSDVERILGTPERIPHSVSPHIRRYSTNHGRVTVTYSTGPCHLKPSNGWNVPEFTVIRFSVHPDSTLKVTDFIIGKGKFEKREDPGILYTSIYSNETDGISIAASDSNDAIEYITYFPESKKNHLKCEGKTNRRRNLTPEEPTPVKKEIWTGLAGGVKLSWLTDEIIFAEGQKRTDILRPTLTLLHQSAVKRVRAAVGTKQGTLVTSRAQASVRSVVGPLVTLEIRFVQFSTNAPPTNWTWWLTLDLEKKGEVAPFRPRDIENGCGPRCISLTEIFTDSELLNALLAVPSVRNAIETQNRARPPKSLSELLSNEGRYSGTPRLETEDGNYFINEYSFEHFLFDRVENDRVVVRMALATYTLTRQAEVKFVEISLPLPKRLLEHLGNARTLKGGFLNEAFERISDGAYTEIVLTTRVDE